MTQGVDTRIGIGASDPVDYELDIISESLKKTSEIIDASGIRGSRSHASERTRAGVDRVGGQIVLEPSPEDLAVLFPWILGAAAVSTTYSLAETIPTRYIEILRGPNAFRYDGCVASRATFSSSAGETLRLTIDVVGVDEVVDEAANFPSLTYAPTPPFVMMDGVMTLLSSARKFDQMNLVINNAVDAERFFNSTTIASAPAQDRIVSLGMSTPYTTDEEDLYDQALLGAAATLVFTNGAYSLSFAFATLQAPAESPTTPGKTEVLLPLNYVARKSGSTDEVTVTLDSTP